MVISRNGYIERVWRIKYIYNKFNCYLFIRGTEPEMQNYMESEMPYVGSYKALEPSDVSMIEELGIEIYIAPQINVE